MKKQFIVRTTIAFFFAASALMLFSSCNPSAQEKETDLPKSFVISPEWSKNANIYEVNVRQFTKEGTFSAFQTHLPRLKNMGVDILWLMPVTPIGELNRKGTQGSYYSVKDYMAVNPEFGTMEDFKALVAEAHQLGMYVILDWVANHTAWDNHLVTEKPEWYTRDSLGNMVSPFDWSDVVDLNYDNPELWDYMIEALKFWVVETGVDGYRCDVANMVPTEFWNRARKELDAIKPVFMLAEAEEPELHTHAFDMAYAWAMHHVMNKIATGENNANHIDSMLQVSMSRFPAETYMMHFTSNHDENSWAGTEYKRLGDGVQAFAALTATIPGMPLIYSGQEAAMDKMLEFFEKDEIDWTSIPLEPFYKELLTLKHKVPALWNGTHGGNYTRILTGENEKVFAFVRQKGSSKVFVILNLSGDNIETTLEGRIYADSYKTAFTDENIRFRANSSVALGPWEYQVYYKE